VIQDAESCNWLLAYDTGGGHVELAVAALGLLLELRPETGGTQVSPGASDDAQPPMVEIRAPTRTSSFRQHTQRWILSSLPT
jgi:hypothetical protein